MSIDNINYKNTFDTEDFGQAIALSCLGHKLIKLEPNHKTKRISFCFLRTVSIDQDALYYWSGNLLVDAKAYWSESKTMRTRLYEVKNHEDKR